MRPKKRNDLFTTPGERLRAIRAFCAPSRQVFCQETLLSESTLKAWENDISPLTGKGANLLAGIFQQKGIACTQAWLLRGESPSPLREMSALSLRKPGEEDCIAQEMALLQLCYQRPRSHFISFEVQDSVMEPFFCKGDWVAGTEISFAKLKLFLQAPVILQQGNGEFFVRKFIGFQSPNTLLTQTLVPSEMPVQQETIKPKAVYQILWHRRLKR